MDNKGGNKKNRQDKKPINNFSNTLFWFLIIAGFLFLLKTSLPPMVAQKEIKYADFYKMVSENKQNPTIKSATKIENTLQGELHDNGFYKVNVPENDQDIIKALRENVPNFEIKQTGAFWNFIISLAPMLLFILFLWFSFTEGPKAGRTFLVSVKAGQSFLSKKEARKSHL